MTNSTGDGHSESTGESAPLDSILAALGNRRLRNVVEYCRSHPGRTIAIGDVADDIVAKRQRSGRDADREAVLTHLHHVDLPKLAENDVIEFDYERGSLRYLPDDRLERWLERIRAEQRR